jgi:hypothetical protein
MNEYLQSTDVIDWEHPEVVARARSLASGCEEQAAIVRQCFEWVRDEVKHSHDHGLQPVTRAASKVLKVGSGIYYAKSHLLAALLRANGIPTALCYPISFSRRRTICRMKVNRVEGPVHFKVRDGEEEKLLMTDRKRARALARQFLDAGSPLGWFEPLYLEAASGSAAIPWADLRPNPNLVEWLDRRRITGDGQRALVVGCGYGDDAEELARRGFDVIAFDISPTAIARCRERFPDSVVSYEVPDLLAPPPSWHQQFGFVFEAYTLQATGPVESSIDPRRRASQSNDCAATGRANA